MIRQPISQHKHLLLSVLQALITGAFSMVHQCMAMGCFPRLKVHHTSEDIGGQIFIPEVCCIARQPLLYKSAHAPRPPKRGPCLSSHGAMRHKGNAPGAYVGRAAGCISAAYRAAYGHACARVRVCARVYTAGAKAHTILYACLYACLLPQVNYTLLVLCVAVVAGFQSGTAIGNAYGIAVNMVMLSTVFLVSLVMLVAWGTHPLLVLMFFVPFAFVEGVFLSANILNIPHGGWFSITLAGMYGFVLDEMGPISSLSCQQHASMMIISF